VCQPGEIRSLARRFGAGLSLAMDKEEIFLKKSDGVPFTGFVVS